MPAAVTKDQADAGKVESATSLQWKTVPVVNDDGSKQRQGNPLFQLRLASPASSPTFMIPGETYSSSLCNPVASSNLLLQRENLLLP